AIENRQRFEALFDALVRVAEPLLEPQHLFADDLEAAMPWLDDSGVHRADGNFVNAVAFDLHEVVFLLSRFPLGGGNEVAPKGKLVNRPAREPQPRALVVGLGRDADEIVRCALHAIRGRKDRGQVRVARVGVGQRVLEHGEAVAILDDDANAEAAPPIALVARPERDELPVVLPREPAGGEKLTRAHLRALRGNAGGERSGGESERGDVHPVYPMSFAALRYQSARNGGIHRPSISTSARCTNTGIIAGRTGSRAAVVSPKTIGCTLEKIAANATPSAISRNGVAHGCSRIADVRIRNSLANTPNGGMPRIASAPIARPHPTTGLIVMRPRMSSMICVPAFCAACPAAKKIADLVSECTVMWSRPAKLAI